MQYEWNIVDMLWVYQAYNFVDIYFFYVYNARALAG